MWFKQTDPKSSQQPEPPAARPQVPPAAPPVARTAGPAPAPEHANQVLAPAAAPAHAAFPSRITPGLTLKGQITGSEDLWVGGTLEGKLHFAGARVTVGTSGSVRGEMEAREIVMEGRMDGNLRAGERIAVSRTGQVKGDAAAPRVALEEGAFFNGAIDVLREGAAHSAARAPAGPAQSASSARPVRNASSQASGAAAGAGSAPAPSPGIAAGGPAGTSERSGVTQENVVAPRGIAVVPPATESE